MHVHLKFASNFLVQALIIVHYVLGLILINKVFFLNGQFNSMSHYSILLFDFFP
jgi:hypothetical protein